MIPISDFHSFKLRIELYNPNVQISEQMLFTVTVINNGKVHNSSVLVYRPETGILYSKRRPDEK